MTWTSRETKITNDDNYTKLVQSILNTLSLWLNICILQLFLYIPKPIQLFNKLPKIPILNYLIRLKRFFEIKMNENCNAYQPNSSFLAWLCSLCLPTTCTTRVDPVPQNSWSTIHSFDCRLHLHYKSPNLFRNQYDQNTLVCHTISCALRFSEFAAFVWFVR